MVVVLDPEIPKIVDVAQGLKPGGKLVFNSPSTPVGSEELAARSWCVNATRIARELGLVVSGWPVVNTAMLGALVKATGILSLDSVVRAIKDYFKGKGRLGELNAEAAVEAYKQAAPCPH